MGSIFRVWGLGFRAGLGAVKPTTVLLLQRRWADAVRELNSECAARRGDVCLSAPAFLVAVFACSVSGDWVLFFCFACQTSSHTCGTSPRRIKMPLEVMEFLGRALI